MTHDEWKDITIWDLHYEMLPAYEGNDALDNLTDEERSIQRRWAAEEKLRTLIEENRR